MCCLKTHLTINSMMFNSYYLCNLLYIIITRYQNKMLYNVLFFKYFSAQILRTDFAKDFEHTQSLSRFDIVIYAVYSRILNYAVVTFYRTPQSQVFSQLIRGYTYNFTVHPVNQNRMNNVDIFTIHLCIPRTEIHEKVLGFPS